MLEGLDQPPEGQCPFPRPVIPMACTGMKERIPASVITIMPQTPFSLWWVSNAILRAWAECLAIAGHVMEAVTTLPDRDGMLPDFVGRVE